MSGDDNSISRRSLIAGAAAAAGGVLLNNLPLDAQQKAAAQSAPVAPPPAPIPDDPTKMPGAPTTAVGARAPFENPQRTPANQLTGSARTPLQDLTGTITPADLHFIRNHAGTPAINPATHRLIMHGLVDRPMTFSLEDLKRFPQSTRTCFIECSGNGGAAYHAPRPDMSPQEVDGLLSTSEWTGVALPVLLDEIGVKKDAKWFLAEGSDACLLARSIPIAKGRDDAMIVWAQNGEPIRPEQGYPMRLLLPGYEGNMNVKWLRRLKFAAEPFMTRWETAKYTDPLLGEKARMFSFEVDAKSIITSPAYPYKVAGKGYHPISGLAWSGRGRITRVDVSTDGGKSWQNAELLSPLTSKNAVRFQYMWNWQGNESYLMSRAVDDTGYVQPTDTELRAARGPGTLYHYNGIRGWRVATDGTVTFEAHT